MEDNIILIHAGLAILFLLYLLIRLFISLFGISNKDFQKAIRAKFRIPDWIFLMLILLTGLYPIVALGRIELYHLIKLIFLGGVLWSSRYATKLNFTLVTFVGILVMVYSAFASFKDEPKFPQQAGTFEQDHPEIANLPELEKGQYIFTTLCVQCHGNDGKKGRFQATDLTTIERTLEQKVETITYGSPLTVMRSFQNELSEEEIQAVAKYVHRFAKD